MTAKQAMELDRQQHENNEATLEDLIDHLTFCDDMRCECEAQATAPDSLF